MYKTSSYVNTGTPLTFAKSGSKTKIKTAHTIFEWKPGKYFPSLFKFYESVTYKVKGKKVLATTSCDNYVLYNYSLVASIDKMKDKRHASNNHAYTYARYRYVLGFKGIGAHLGNLNFSMWANYKGQVIDTHAWRN